MKTLIISIALMVMAQNAFGKVKCDLFQDTQLKYYCNKMEKTEKQIAKLKLPDSSTNLSFLLFDHDVEMINEHEMGLLREEARKSDQKEFSEKLKVLQQKRLIYFKSFLLRKRQIKEINKARKKRDSIYGLLEHGKKTPKKQKSNTKYSYDPHYGWVETITW